MFICLERGVDLHMAQLMPLPLIVSCFCKVQVGLIFLVPAHLGSPRKRAVKWVCVCAAAVPSVLKEFPGPGKMDTFSRTFEELWPPRSMPSSVTSANVNVRWFHASEL